MSELLPLTPEQLARAENRLRNPAPGSRIEAAKEYGIDLSLVIAQLRLTPAERARNLEDGSSEIEQVLGVARRNR